MAASTSPSSSRRSSEKQTVETQPVYRRFWAPTAEARREKLMPFFWGTLMREHGSIAGNRALKSVVQPHQSALVLVPRLLGDPGRRGA